MPHSIPTSFLVGPTAVGKSEVALLLAEELDAEIVSADSMQVYRGMDIGTAKPTGEERARGRYHLIDVVDVSQPFHVAQYRALAASAIEDIQKRGRQPLVVGGSGMYLRALAEGLFEGPGADAALRAKLEEHSAEELHARLKRVDPVSAARIPVGNKRRLVRALEVFELTGKPLSAQQTEWKRAAPERPEMILLERDRAELCARIDRRVDWMFANGLVEETRALLERGLAENPTARVAAGYREVIDWLEGRIRRDDAVCHTKLRTRQLAKRQLTWFRHQAKVRVVRAEASAQQTKERVRALVENARG